MADESHVAIDLPLASCTLPTIDQPLRAAEFNDMFGRDVENVDQTSSREVRIDLHPDPDVAARAASLAARETGCCSFFTFDLWIAEGEVALIISVEPGYEPVLAALTTRAQELTSS